MDYPVQTRNLARTVAEYHYTQNGNSYAGNPNGSGDFPFYRGNDVCQSYRTNRDGDNIPESTYSDTSGSQVEFERQLRSDHVDDDSRAFLKYGNSTYDMGHEFRVEHQRYDWFNYQSRLSANGAYGKLGYDGFVVPTLTTSLPVVVFPSEAVSVDDGAKLFKAAKPTKSEAGLVQFFSELVQKMPNLVGGSVLEGNVTPRTASDEYLNLEFGWRPTVNDLQKLAKSVLHASLLTKQYRRDSGRFVHRRRSLPDYASVTELPDQPGNPILGSFFGQNMATYFWEPSDSLGTTSVTDVVRSEAWFVGAFTYLVAQGHSFLTHMDEYEALANHLLGLRFDADTAYELAPFSWLVDWKWDLGTFVSNVTALQNDELVMKYGYVMHSTSATRTYLKTGLSPKGDAPTSLRADVTWSQKTRFQASPYGFGPQGGVDTPRKWAILSALGMTFGSGSLRH